MKSFLSSSIRLRYILYNIQWNLVNTNTARAKNHSEIPDHYHIATDIVKFLLIFNFSDGLPGVHC